MITVFGMNKNYLTKDNEPWFPMMGEMHYSRYPRKYWRESLFKMKAGGIEVVSTYAIWIHHEETEGEYDFTGNKDLRKYVETCRECGLSLLLRIGPWVHGEVRNGGFPDWLLKKGFDCRCNDEEYLEEVKRYYSALYEQVKGLLHKDGGPIIGIQIENELGHCGGAYGEAGEEHMRSLKQIAVELGFEVPIYTATGWGGAVTGGLLPVMGGYPEAPWDQRLTELEPSGNYVFTHERNDHNIGSDYGIGAGVTFDYADFPYLTAELGGGMQVTKHRRPVAEAEDIGAMTLAKLGSGCNLLGYYMYHGGTNPKGKLSTLQETRETGYPNDYTILNYDFRAPIREYGQISETLKEIKLYAMFIKDFGKQLCTMPAFIPEDNPVNPKNLSDLRYSFRHNGMSGFVFVNNYQRRYAMEEHKEVKLQAELPGETVSFPAFDLKNRDYFFLPFNMKLGNVLLRTAMVTPLCILNEKTYIFYGDREPQFEVSGNLEDYKLLKLSRKDALNAWKIKLKKEHLIISNAAVIQTGDGIEMIGREKFTMKVYPDFDTVPEGFEKVGSDGDFTLYDAKMKEQQVLVTTRLKEEESEKKTYEILLNVPEENLEDIFLQLNYQGDRARLFLGDYFIADHFYLGKVWEVGLKQFELPRRLMLEVYPLREDSKVFLEKWPQMKNGIACELSGASAQVEYKVCYELPKTVSKQDKQ